MENTGFGQLITFLHSKKRYRRKGDREFGYLTPSGTVIHVVGRKVFETSYAKIVTRDPVEVPLKPGIARQDLCSFYLGNWRDRYLINQGIAAALMGRAAFFVQPIKLPLLTQLSEEEREIRWDEMSKILQKGDIICTFDCKSKVSRIISCVTNGPWSHTAVYGGDGTILELLITGSCKRSIDSYRDPRYRIGVYRLMVAGLDFDKAIAIAETHKREYSFLKALLTGLERIIFDTRMQVTPNDLASHPDFRLICVV